MSNSIDQVKKETRLRVWCGIFYPESTKSDFIKILENNIIPCCISPLHDQDPEEEDSTKFKKPHYHIVFRFSGSKSFKQVWDILKLIAIDPDHCPPPEKPHSDIEHLVQYLVHANDKSKHQYSRSDIISVAGFDVDRYFKLNSEEEDEIFCFIMDYIESHKIYEYWTLLECLRISRYDSPVYDEAFRFSRSHTMQMNFMLQSRRNIKKLRNPEI